MRWLASVVVASLLALAGIRAEDPPSVAADPRVDEALTLARTWLEAQRAFDAIPGVSAAIVHDQEVLWSGGFGYADTASKRPARGDTMYSICSISKLFTSIAVMQLRDEGKLRLDDPVAKHLPWFTIKRTAPSGPEITIEGLLTHASGLPREADFPYWTTSEFPTHDQIVARLVEQETLYPADKYFQYSNLGLTLAGEIVAAVSGQPYADYVRGRVLTPIGLTSTVPEMPSSERGHRLATGYSAGRREGGRVPIDFFTTNGIAPAAGYASTADDLARFASWQFRLLARGGRDVLAANTLAEMQRVHWVDPGFEVTWGLGFRVWRTDEKTFVGHDGSCPGFRTQLLLRPDEQVAVAFLANAQGVNVQQWSERVYQIVAPRVKEAIKEPGKGSKPDPSLDPYVGTYESPGGIGGEVAVVRWQGGLALLPLPTMDPMRALSKLKKVGAHTFRRIRTDESLAEAVTFDIGPDGRAERIRQNSNYRLRVQRTPVSSNP
jgi:CubicO group peptidase (beta-lactamase class C family)